MRSFFQCTYSLLQKAGHSCPPRPSSKPPSKEKDVEREGQKKDETERPDTPPPQMLTVVWRAWMLSFLKFSATCECVMSVCLWMCACTCVGVQASTCYHMIAEGRGQYWVLVLAFPLSEAGSPCSPMSILGCLGCKLLSLPPTYLRHARTTDSQDSNSIYMGYRDSNPGPHTRAASTLLLRHLPSLDICAG